MRFRLFGFVVLLVMLYSAVVSGESVEDYIGEARKLADGDNMPGAMKILRKALEEHPESSDIHVYLGFYTGMSAGSTGDYMEAGRLAIESFTLLDKAVALDPANYRAYFYRGLMGVKMPPFLGKLDGGINDLNRVIDMHAKSPDTVEKDDLIFALSLLAEGYEKKGDAGSTKGVLEKIVKLAPGSDAAEAAKEQIGKLHAPARKGPGPLSLKEGDEGDIAALKKKIEKDPGNGTLILALGEAYYEMEKWEETREVLKEYVASDETNARAYRLLGIATSRIAEDGYDKRIHDDTDFLSGIAFESMGYLDKVITLDPDDAETRLLRGIFGIMFPFFLGKHDQGVADLKFVAEGDAPEALKAEAKFYLGIAYRHQAMRCWVDVATKYPDSEAARMMYNEIRPRVKRFDPAAVEKPVVAVDFVLGFQDELPPQTVVWIEDDDGRYVKTIYVSGFSGFAKEKQVNLPVWSVISKFEGVEAVTSASIDIGHYIYTWDLTGLDGKKVKRGTYMVRVEVSYWPSMKYQLAEASIDIGKKRQNILVEEGDYIPRLEVTYIPK